MSNSYTTTQAQSFTATNAKHISAKVATDLKRLQRFYAMPSDAQIEAYEIEIIELLKKGYLGTVTYGFKRNGDWIEPTLQYTAIEFTLFNNSDDDPGRVRPGADIEGAGFYSYLTYSAAWDLLTSAEKDKFKENLPFQRQGAESPGLSGYFTNDKTYSSGGKALDRSSLKSY